MNLAGREPIFKNSDSVFFTFVYNCAPSVTSGVLPELRSLEGKFSFSAIAQISSVERGFFLMKSLPWPIG